MVKRVDEKIDQNIMSDVLSTFSPGRDHKALLRSTGHLKRDGRWLGDDDPFHVYRELENPGLGTLRAFQSGPYLERMEPTESMSTPLRAYNWRPSLVRGYSQDYRESHYEYPLPQVVEPSYSDKILELNALGTSYIRRFRPGNPIAGLDQFLIELRELPRLPLLFRSRAKHFRDIGSEYLNVEFGWVPFVKDVIQLGHAQLRMQSVLNQLIKNNGIQVKRRSKRDLVTTGSEWRFGILPYNLPFDWLGLVPDSESELDDLNLFGPFCWDTDFQMTGETVVSWRHESLTETWFVGTYKYYVPDIGSSRWTDKAKLILSGIDFTPKTLYNVYPWTWLADWFANVGDIVSNLTANAVDSEANMNSHVMQTITDRLHVEAHVTWDDFDGGTNLYPYVFIPRGSDVVSYSLIKKQKLRQKSSPFGFGLKTGDFTFRQKSILAALLFSRKVPTPRAIGESMRPIKRRSNVFL